MDSPTRPAPAKKKKVALGDLGSGRQSRAAGIWMYPDAHGPSYGGVGPSYGRVWESGVSNPYVLRDPGLFGASGYILGLEP